MERRNFVKTSALLGASAMLSRYSFANAKGSDVIKVGMVGCGGRGTGAFINMMAADQNIKLVGMADLFQDKLEKGKKRIIDAAKKYKNGADIASEAGIKTFIGVDCLDNLLREDVDVIIDACSPVFRTPNYEKIVAAGKHAFLEKPPCVDAVQARRMLELSKEADKKGLSVVCGTQRRYDIGYQEAIDRVRNGEIGDIVSAQCYWNASIYVGGPKFLNHEELACDTMEYQIRNWFSFIWASGDNIVEQHVHNLDVIMWALGDQRKPKEVRAWGGRSTDLPTPKFGDRFSHFAVDFDMGNGLRLSSYCQQDPKCAPEIGERVVGTKGIMYTNLYGQISINELDGKKRWVFDKAKRPRDCMIEEHAYLLNAIRTGKQVNKIDQLVNSTLLAIAGRLSAYSGKKFKFDWVLAKSKESLCPEKIDFYKKMPMNGVPVPGKYELI
ncbi:MAG: Gfo/Idh/MocA family oxidoreductase [Opitutales bacterium]|nr:Gfo/Idh/MocA family oxidoreductase [Opitutales bacterium]